MERIPGEGSRRAFLAKLGAAGVTAWTTPTVVSVTAAAAQSGVTTTTTGPTLSGQAADAARALIATVDPANHPKPSVVAACLHANALLGDPTATLADRVWDLRETWAGHAGWGIKAPWDAFGDGSTNPATTIYGVTTALVGLAFAAAGDDRACEAEATLVSPILNADPGIHYSDQSSDQAYTVWNIWGVGLWLLHSHGHAAHASIVSDLADGLTDALGVGTGVSPWQWEYHVGSATENDLNHWGLIAEPLDRATGSTVVTDHLHRFHAGSGKTKEHDSSPSAVTDGRCPATHLELATFANVAWRDSVAADLVASVSDGVTSYARQGAQFDNDMVATARALARYASVS